MCVCVRVQVPEARHQLGAVPWRGLPLCEEDSSLLSKPILMRCRQAALDVRSATNPLHARQESQTTVFQSMT
eukprot:2331717-Amphidinium_carterae.2